MRSIIFTPIIITNLYTILITQRVGFPVRGLSFLVISCEKERKRNIILF